MKSRILYSFHKFNFEIGSDQINEVKQIDAKRKAVKYSNNNSNQFLSFFSSRFGFNFE